MSRKAEPVFSRLSSVAKTSGLICSINIILESKTICLLMCDGVIVLSVNVHVSGA